MENTQITQENNVDTVVEQNTGVESTPTNGEVEPTPTATTEQVARTFTQEEVNDIVRERLEKSKKSLYTRYGVADRDELDDLLGKAQAHDVHVERIEELRRINASQAEELLFLKNNIEPSRYDDIRANFKGKGLELNAETFGVELATHPEWLKVEPKSETTTIKVMGATQTNGNTNDTDTELIGKWFGIKL